jgi:hypothetical protein
MEIELWLKCLAPPLESYFYAHSLIEKPKNAILGLVWKKRDREK